MFSMSRLLLFFALFSFVLIASLFPAPFEWDGEAGDSVWSNNSNWDPDGTPGSGDTVTIGSISPPVGNWPTVGAGGRTVDSLILDNTNNPTLTLNGNLTV
jgi:hypothetical protein